MSAQGSGHGPGQSPGLSLIEQVNAPLCQTPRRPYLKAINQNDNVVIFFRPRCKLWSCPACSEINKNLWSVKAFHAATVIEETHGKPDFLTLTSHEKLQAKASLFVWPKAWSKLSQRARRKAADFQYLLIPEQHKNGRLHVHAIETSALGERWWKTNARECGLGYMAEEEEVRSPGGAAYYVVKYLTKSLETNVWPKNFRRVRTSQRWPKLPETEPLNDWTFTPLERDATLAHSVATYEREGMDVLLLDHWEAWRTIQFVEEME